MRLATLPRPTHDDGVETIAKAVVERGNLWCHFVPDGLRLSGAVVDNPGLVDGRWDVRWRGGGQTVRVGPPRTDG